MTSNRFLFGASEFDLKYEFRVADLTRVERTIEDFWNEEEEAYEYLEYLNYLYLNNGFLTGEEAEKIFNGLHEENQELQHKLSQQEMEYATDLHWLTEKNEELRTRNNAYLQDIEVYREENTHLKLENDQLKQKVDFYKYFQKDARELEKENEQLKEEIKDLNDILARYEQKELESIAKKDKSCGHCKHLQIDGMFGMWCEKKHNWTEVEYCKDFKR